MDTGIKRIFARIPRTYEATNHILTFGLDILWRRRTAKMAARSGGDRWVDVCSGTGETALLLAGLADGGAEIYAVDFSQPMLERIGGKRGGGAVTPVLSDIKRLPFPDGTFDLVTISFATRNINLSREVLVSSFREFERVLRPGGRFVNLETSQPTAPLARSLFHIYVRMFVRPIGRLISGSSEAYAYLAGSISRFYTAEELAAVLREAGFENVGFRRMTFGAVAVHRGSKPAGGGS